MQGHLSRRRCSERVLAEGLKRPSALIVSSFEPCLVKRLILCIQALNKFKSNKLRKAISSMCAILNPPKRADLELILIG